MDGLGHAADGLGPAEGLLDLLAPPLREGVARVPGGSAVDGGMARLPRDVRGDAGLAQVAPDPGAALATDRCFLPVEIVEGVQSESGSSAADVRDPGGLIEIDVAGGPRMRISGRYDPEALARLIRGLSG